MNLKEQIQNDLLQAMKSKDSIKTETLRMLKAAIMKWEVSGPKKVADDETVLAIIGKEVKMRKEASEAYEKGGKNDLAKKELLEADLLMKYLPEQLDESEVKIMVQDILKELGVETKSEKGKAMSSVMFKLKGKADGKIIARTVDELLI